MSNVPSYRPVKLCELRIILGTLLIQSKDRERLFKLKKVTKLKNLTGRNWWLTLDLGTLIHQKFKAKKGYQKCTKDCLKIRNTHMGERARDIKVIVNARLGSRLQALLAIEKLRHIQKTHSFKTKIQCQFPCSQN